MKLTLWLRPVLLFAPFLIQAGLVQAQTYKTAFNDSEWLARSGPFACSLQHKVAGFGEAYFIRNAGTAEVFEFKNAKKAFPSGALKVEAIPPAWRSDASSANLGQLKVTDSRSFSISTEQLASIYAALAQGTNLVVSSAEVGGQGDSLRVVLQAHNFSAAFGTYQQCRKALIPYTFDQLSRSQINYAINSQELSDATKNQLDKIVRYTKADPRVLGILVDAHSDKRKTPEEAEEVAQQQAELVTAYLIEKGLSADSIITRWHGDKFPVASNQNKAGQSKNRRVTVRMENEATRKAMEKKVAAIKEAEQKAAEKAAQASSDGADLPVNLQQLEQMVEQQNLTSGKQPDITSLR
jgi:sodium-type flagellar protein MotY